MVVPEEEVVEAHACKKNDGSFASKSREMRQERTMLMKAAREQAA